MILLTTIFILLTGAASTFAVIQTLRADIPRRKKTVFVLIRTAIAILLLLAFLEPVLTLHRLPHRDRPLTVLVDASTSMSLFATDSTINVIIDKIQAIGNARGRKTAILLFGDSLREKKTATRYAAADRKSFFPTINSHPALRDADGVLIISDGNWSNSDPVSADFAVKPVNFLSLTLKRNPAFLSVTAPDTVLSAAGVRCTVQVECSGYAPDDADITVEAADDNKTVFTEAFRVAAGRFSRPVGLQLPAWPAGMHLFRLTLTNLRDTVSSRQYVVCRAVPASFTYTITTGTPSLDERFLRLSLATMPVFKETTIPGGTREQVRFILHAPMAEIPALPTLPVYIGCLPVASTQTDTVSGADLFLPSGALRNPLDGLMLHDVPPIALVKPSRNLSPVDVWLAARTAARDTLPLLYHATLRGRSLIACGFDGLWKWDFLPLSHRQGEADAQMFSRRLLAITQSTLINVATDTMIIWPVGQPSAFSPLKLACITPHNDPSTGNEHRVACSITGGSQSFGYDTVLTLSPNGPVPQYVLLPPLQPGDYSVHCSLSTPFRTYLSTVPFTVTTDNSELLTTEQNTTLLNELGLPVSIGDTTRITALFGNADRTAINQPIGERVPIQRSWWILGALFALFGLEWVMRRTLRLD